MRRFWDGKRNQQHIFSLSLTSTPMQQHPNTRPPTKLEVRKIAYYAARDGGRHDPVKFEVELKALEAATITVFPNFDGHTHLMVISNWKSGFLYYGMTMILDLDKGEVICD